MSVAPVDAEGRAIGDVAWKHLQPRVRRQVDPRTDVLFDRVIPEVLDILKIIAKAVLRTLPEVPGGTHA